MTEARDANRHGRCRIRHRHRASLRRILFLWFVVAIVVSGGTFALVTHTMGRQSFRHEAERIERFAARRFEAVWDDVDRRNDLAQSIERDLGVGVTLYDAGMHRVRESGLVCHGGVHRLALAQGSAQFCLNFRDRGGPSGPLRLMLAFALAALVLAMLSGKLARILTRPLREVTEVARALGEGDLAARVGSGRHRGEVRILAKSINDMADTIEKQLSDQKELLAAVSHEMRTPLGHVRILLELAREGRLDTDAIDELEREIEEMDALVGELLARSRLDFEAIDRRPVDLVVLIRRSLQRVGLATNLLEGPENCTIIADPTLLGRALTNLLDNAERHGKGVVRVTLTQHGRNVAIGVEDAGDGFSREARAKLGLEAAPSSTESAADRPREETQPAPSPRHPSLGLGLALTRRIAEAHDGQLKVESAAHATETLAKRAAAARPGSRVVLELRTQPIELSANS